MHRAGKVPRAPCYQTVHLAALAGAPVLSLEGFCAMAVAVFHVRRRCSGECRKPGPRFIKLSHGIGLDRRPTCITFTHCFRRRLQKGAFDFEVANYCLVLIDAESRALRKSGVRSRRSLSRSRPDSWQRARSWSRSRSRSSYLNSGSG